MSNRNKKRPSMSPQQSMTFKPKKRVKTAKKRYVKPGALAQLRYNRRLTRSCTDIGKKRVTLVDSDKKVDLLSKKEPATPRSPRRIGLRSVGLGGETTPKTPAVVSSESHSVLESLPTDLLVKIMCHLHHDQLKAVFHVSQRIRAAVILARQEYFNYTTPDRSRQEMLNILTPCPTERWPFPSKGDGKGSWSQSPNTPKAPKHGPRPPRRYRMKIAPVLFHEAFPPRNIMPPGLPMPDVKPLASNRVLFYEDELCQAVAQNKLR